MLKAVYTFLLITVLPAVLLTACKKEGLITYNVPDNIYFNYMAGVKPAEAIIGILNDSLNFTFSYSNATVKDTLLPIPVMVTGAPANTDRSFRVTVASGATAVEGKHYHLPSFVIHAGRIVDTMLIPVERTEDLRQREVAFTLQLQPDETFKTGIPYRINRYGDTVNALIVKIKFSDILSGGSNWASYAGYFGNFSEKKVMLMNQVVGLPLDFWAPGTTFDSEKMARATYYATTMSRYLKQQAAAGNTIYEADGVTPMIMGADYQ